MKSPMESLAYLQSAVTYEEPQAFTPNSSALSPFHRETWCGLSGRAATRMVSIACSLVVFGLSSAALAFPLRIGDVGADVSELQTLLNLAGYNSGQADGSFGPITEIALANFQRESGIVVDGIYGSETRAALLAASGASTATGERATSFNTTAAAPLATPAVPTAGALRLGDRGPGVEALQASLNNNGCDAGAVDGVFGTRTEAAVIACQSRLGLGLDGIAGPATLTALGLDANTVLSSTTVASSTTSTFSTSTSDDRDDDRDRYVVVVPGRGENLRTNVDQSLRALNPTLPLALQDDSRRGGFINAGIYPQRSYAESVSEWLRYRGFDARVEYD